MWKFERKYTPIKSFTGKEWSIAVEFPWGIPVAIKKTGGSISLFWKDRPLDLISPIPEAEGFIEWGKEQSSYWKDIHSNIIVYGRYMNYVCGVIYSDLPDWFIATDCWEGEKYLNWDEFELICKILNLSYTPVLARGFFSYEKLRTKFGCLAESCGIMVFQKNREILYRNGEDKSPEYNQFNQRRTND